jgi:putative DNA primase/helicase
METRDPNSLNLELGPEAAAEINRMMLANARYRDKRPEIIVEAGNINHLAVQTVTALLKAKLPLYEGGTGLVMPAGRDVDTAEGNKVRVTALIPVSLPIMLRFMDFAAHYLHWNARKKRNVTCDPPENIARLVLADSTIRAFQRIIGVLSAPTIGSDGTLIRKEGLDRRSSMLLAGLPKLPVIADEPSKEEAEDALVELNSLLNEYAFRDDKSRSVALSMLISPLCRGLLPLLPLHAVTAPVAGSGKSYLASIASAILTGRPCPVIPPAERSEEFEKRLTGALLSGLPILSFDNVDGKLDDPTLCQALEQRLIRVRALGSSQLHEIEQRASWFANGNNLEIAQDLTRRTLLCEVDRNEERPELVEYHHQPFKLVLADRGRYIAAGLTIVLAYIAAGRPGRLPPLASYDEWSDNVRSALVWLDCADPCDTMMEVRRGDSSLTRLKGLYAAWARSLAIGQEYTAKEVIEAATTAPLNMNSELADAIKECCGNKVGVIDTKGLGNYLAKRALNRVLSIDFGDADLARLKMTKDERMQKDNVTRWRLVQLK